MNGYFREEARRDTCRNHSGRPEREPFRVCPSKLSKRELEDLYYTVLENNVELKKTINSQQERIKVLSTKVQRMTVTQRGGPVRDNDCCSYIKAMVNEQKQSIADLKKANENMSERIRVLNMRLCSAKQFLRRSPVASMARCTKAPGVPLSVKNSSMSVLNVKTSDSNVKSAGVSSQYLDKDVVLSTRTVETETAELEKENTEKLCDENKCRSQIAELKQKIVDLQEELAKTHESYSLRISRLEEEVMKLREEKQREQAQRAADSQVLQQRGEQLDHLATRLCAAESQYAELALELAIEKRKVAELETRVKAADMSAAVAKTIQEHLNNTDQVKKDIESQRADSRRMSIACPETQNQDIRKISEMSPRDQSYYFKYDLPAEQGCSRKQAALALSEPKDDIIIQSKPSRFLDDSGFIADSPEVDKNKTMQLEVPVQRKDLYMETPDQVDQHRASKLSQDSGVVANSPNLEETKETRDVDEEIYNRMSFLQHQLDVLKSSALLNNNTSAPQCRKSIISVDKQKSQPNPCKALYFDPEAHARAGPAPALVITSSAPVADSYSKMTLPKEKKDTSRPPSNAGSEKVEVEHSALGIDEIKALQSASALTDQDRKFTLDENTTHKMEKEAQEAYSRMSFRKRRTYGSNLEGFMEGTQGLKADSHNSMQIPGPLPVDDATSTGSPAEKGRRRRHSIDKKTRHSKKDSNDSTISHCREVISLDLDSKQRLKVKSAIAQKTLAEDSVTSTPKEEKNLILGEDSYIIQTSTARTSEKDRSDGLDRRDNATAISRAGSPVSLSAKATEMDGMIKVVGPSVMGKFMEDDVSVVVPAANAYAGKRPDEPGKRPPGPAVVDVSIPEVTMGAPPVVDVGGPIEFCSRYARLCACPLARRRDVSVFRTCSGTLRFRTVPAASAPLRQCACPPQHESKYKAVYADTRADEDQVSKASDPRPESAPCSKGAQTYSVPACSPDNTDCEISSMTDLPSERDSKSPRILSPGEEKATTSTYTGTQTATTPTTTEYGTLSEGELPGAGEVTRMSAGEAKVNFRDAKERNSQTPRHPPQRMEDALNAISEELALCRDLLQARHSQKRASKDASLMVDLRPGPIALKRAAASPRIGDAFTPKCIFTLHIGTVVLSDEAVINSRSMSLVLMWKFYDQNVTMSRMKAGRVVLFDFSTEYDVKITDQFLDYMKHEEMQLVICEVNKQWEPFASCALRLRETLLHTNRRADMSLALVAGPQLRLARANRDNLDAGDEVGVLDLWCMLRVDPSLLPAISRAITNPHAVQEPLSTEEAASTSVCGRARRGSRCLAQISAEDHYNDRLSEDLEKHLKRPKKYSVYDYDMADEQTVHPMHCPAPDNVSVASQTHSLTPRATCDINQNKNLEKNFAPPHGPGQVGFKSDADAMSTTSRILVNEVVPTNRSPNEMKAAIDDNLSRNSTTSSWRGLVTRRIVTKEGRRASFVDKNAEEKETKGVLPSFFKYRGKQKRNSKSKGLPAPIMRTSLDIDEPPELNRSHRVLNASKKSVTYTDEAYPPTRISFDREPSDDQGQFMEITILWLALNEECDAMANPKVQRLYVAYAFLGRSGADLETPTSLPKPTSYVDKCFFHFSKTFQLNECDLPLLAHMAKCRSSKNTVHDPKDCVVFTVISEPPEDPLGLDSCVDIGYAYLYLGDLLEYSAGNDTYTEVIPVLSATAGEAVCGVLCVKVDGLDVLRQCSLSLTHHRASTTTR